MPYCQIRVTMATSALSWPNAKERAKMNAQQTMQARVFIGDPLGKVYRVAGCTKIGEFME
jgi:hypothetical protein